MEGKKKGLIKKTWERCKSMRGHHNQSRESDSTGGGGVLFKSKSWAAFPQIPVSPEQGGGGGRRGGSIRGRRRKDESTPQGCFPVYVGETRERFVLKTKYANHPLFVALLEEAEMEYGFCSDGPLLLPCEAEVFGRVLIRMRGGGDCGLGDDYEDPNLRCNCSSFPTRSPTSYNRLVTNFSPVHLASR